MLAAAIELVLCDIGKHSKLEFSFSNRSLNRTSYKCSTSAFAMLAFTFKITKFLARKTT